MSDLCLRNWLHEINAGQQLAALQLGEFDLGRGEVRCAGAPLHERPVRNGNQRPTANGAKSILGTANICNKLISKPRLQGDTLALREQTGRIARY